MNTGFLSCEDDNFDKEQNETVDLNNLSDNNIISVATPLEVDPDDCNVLLGLDVFCSGGVSPDAISVHNNLLGLQGGTLTARYHLTPDQWQAVENADAPSATNPFITTSAMPAITWGSIIGKPNNGNFIFGSPLTPQVANISLDGGIAITGQIYMGNALTLTSDSNYMYINFGENDRFSYLKPFNQLVWDNTLSVGNFTITNEPELTTGDYSLLVRDNTNTAVRRVVPGETFIFASPTERQSANISITGTTTTDQLVTGLVDDPQRKVVVDGNGLVLGESGGINFHTAGQLYYTASTDHYFISHGQPSLSIQDGGAIVRSSDGAYVLYDFDANQNYIRNLPLSGSEQQAAEFRVNAGTVGQLAVGNSFNEPAGNFHVRGTTFLDGNSSTGGVNFYGVAIGNTGGINVGSAVEDVALASNHSTIVVDNNTGLLKRVVTGGYIIASPTEPQNAFIKLVGSLPTDVTSYTSNGVFFEYNGIINAKVAFSNNTVNILGDSIYVDTPLKGNIMFINGETFLSKVKITGSEVFTLAAPEDYVQLGNLNASTSSGTIRTVFSGDSITDETPPTGFTTNYPSQLSTLNEFIGASEKYNIGLGGDTAFNYIASGKYTSSVYPHRPIKPSDISYLFIRYGINDLANIGRTPAQVYDDLKTIWAQAKADGFEVIAFTLTPIVGAVNTLVNDLNVLIRSDRSLYFNLADNAASFAAAGILAGDSSYFLDNVHPNQAGSAIIARDAYNSLNRTSWNNIIDADTNGKSADSILWNGNKGHLQTQSSGNIFGLAVYDLTNLEWRYDAAPAVQNFLSINNGSTLNNNIDGNAKMFGGNEYEATAIITNPTYIMTFDTSNSKWKPADQSQIKTFLATSLQDVVTVGSGVTGKIQVGTAPTNPTDVVRLTDLGNYVDKTTAQTIAGVKTFTSGVIGPGFYSVGSGSAAASIYPGEVNITATSLNAFTITPGSKRITFSDAGQTTYLTFTTPTSPRNIVLPNASGTVALLSDLGGYVDLTTNQTIGGSKTFSNTTFIGINGSASFTALETGAVTTYSGATITGKLLPTGLQFVNSAFSNAISQATLTANRTQVIPDKSGTFAMLSDITGGGGTWGSITGTLSDQTDLQSALNAKANLAGGNTFDSSLQTFGTTGTGRTYVNNTGVVVGSTSDSKAAIVNVNGFSYRSATSTSISIQFPVSTVNRVVNMQDKDGTFAYLDDIVPAVQVFVQPGEPTGGTYNTGDIWIVE